MGDWYSPQTGEHIRTDVPAPWMGRAGVPAPDYDPATQSAFWRGDHWEIVTADISQPDYSVLQSQAYQTKSDPTFSEGQQGETPPGA